ncbi:hypothetical protein B0F90DRAFT_1695109 [Multifurca ochricompacta]|uniref:RRM Nup35-type domain-containing protein n=1 Tax=Multifurca ochricompacta TaxID=376703 RepID=A0AAD4MB79_9AGAM|nr:hypothetical protein B0F90DRAFT_1695109 [Multifurca ochricompacta]
MSSIFSQSSAFHSPDNATDRIRPSLNHSASQTSLHGSSFSIGGMTNSTNTHHPHGTSSWASNSQSSALSSSLNDPFLQSRSNYQSGYLMSMSQNNASPPANQRFDDMPLVQTKAKLNSTLSRAPTREFGKDPMFESSRQRQASDEDAPPTASVNDILNATYTDGPSYLQRSTSNFESSMTRVVQPAPHPTNEPLYVIVFGYPPDKYSVAVDYFKQLGETTDPDPNTEISNCFKIGFKHPGDAMWAVRKNGELVSGSWMVGVKWADPGQAERVLGQSMARTAAYLPTPDVSSPSDAVPIEFVGPSRSPHQPSLSTGRSPHSNTSTVGTPIRLAPSTSAFRKPGQAPKTATNTPGPQPATPLAIGAPGTPSKGMLGQFSDFVFGW